MENVKGLFSRLKARHWLVLLALALVAAVWLEVTPPGLMGKEDGIAYAVCHRLSLRSFHFGERPLPLCARCSGTFTMALLGFVYLGWRGRRAGWPKRWVTFLFLGFLAIYGLDGVNSYLQLIPNFPGLYVPQNWLRLATGSLIGLAVPVYLLPAFHQIVWKEADERPALDGWKDLAVLLAIAVGVNLAMLTENPLLLYPLALISTAGVLGLFTLIFTLIWILLLRRENSFDRYGQLFFFAVGGLASALFLILVISTVRLALTQTWDGFPLPWPVTK